jgi:haloacetate dehalogenase
MADDVRALLDHLSLDRVDLVGHDRGSYVAFRLALDSPERMRRLVLIDCIPIVEHLERMSPAFATAWWHWFFYAQPDKPERAVLADPDAWYGGDPAAMGVDNFTERRAAIHDPDVVRAMIEDYRAGLTVDADDERADRSAGRRVECPLQVLWSERDDLVDLFGDPVAIWRGWARDVRGHGIDSGHHVAEEQPVLLAAAIVDSIGR